MKNADCVMEVTFGHTREGRPEIYDFLWDHTPGLFKKVKAKKIIVRLKGGQKVPLSHRQWLEKFTTQKRFSFRAKRIKTNPAHHAEAVVPLKELEHVLSAYNLLFDFFFTGLEMEAPPLSLDFSHAPDYMVTIHTQKKNAPIIEEYLLRACQKTPYVRTVSFPSPEFMESVSQKKTSPKRKTKNVRHRK